MYAHANSSILSDNPPFRQEHGMARKRVNQPLSIPHRRRRPVNGEPAPAWPSFTGTAEMLGASATGVTVYVDTSLSEDGLQNARDLLAGADDAVRQNNAIFGIDGGPVQVIVYALGGATDGTGGADHGGCDFHVGGAIEVDASYGNSERVIALFEAELSECAMNGNLCGLSTGEALSRWCAMVVGKNSLADFASAPQWFKDGMPNWVDKTADTDREEDSTGCGMAFLSWLGSQGHGLATIAQAMVKLEEEAVQANATATLAGLYAQLTGNAANGAWQAFKDAIDALPGGVTSDDPFGALAA
jgi:hypothetical protein